MAFLAIAVGIFAFGAAVIWWQTRSTRGVSSGVDAFHHEMEALAPRSAQQPAVQPTELRLPPRAESINDRS